MGKSKALLVDPTCNFQGKEISAIAAMTTLGTITGKIISQVLKHPDDLDLY